MKILKSFAAVFLLVLSLAPAPSVAQTVNTQRIDSLLNMLSAKNKFMGCVTIEKNDRILYNKAFGSALIEPDMRKVSSTETKYRIGSISKMFTSVMIFQLIEEKKLSLDTKLADFFPEIPNAGNITISQMLNHHSGIHSVTDDSTYLSWNTQHQTQTRMIGR